MEKHKEEINCPLFHCSEIILINSYKVSFQSYNLVFFVGMWIYVYTLFAHI